MHKKVQERNNDLVLYMRKVRKKHVITVRHKQYRNARCMHKIRQHTMEKRLEKRYMNARCMHKLKMHMYIKNIQ